MLGGEGYCRPNFLPSCNLPSCVRREVNRKTQKWNRSTLGENTCYREKSSREERTRSCWGGGGRGGRIAVLHNQGRPPEKGDIKCNVREGTGWIKGEAGGEHLPGRGGIGLEAGAAGAT